MASELSLAVCLSVAIYKESSHVLQTESQLKNSGMGGGGVGVVGIYTGLVGVYFLN